VNSRAVFPELRTMGYVFQSPNLFPWRTVLENVRFGLQMAGELPAVEQRRQAGQYLSLVGLSEAADKLPHQLSGGMRQRVALARALALEPGLLLMDEPFAALDAITRRAMQEELLRIWRALGQTVVFITRDMEEAIFLADRILVLGLPPQGIRAAFEIALPRPRDGLLTRRSARFAEYRDQISQSIATSLEISAPFAARSRHHEPA
jgi:NitT/TauT family transport system ATP-binding protein